MKIQIIGTEGPLQEELKSRVEDIIHEEQLECQLDVVHNIKEILELEEKQIFLTPALVIDDKILTQGHNWSKTHIKSFITSHCRKRADAQPKSSSGLPEQFAKWKGIPREEIEWYPRVDTDKCAGCGMCVTSCGRSVFDFDAENGVSVVARPLQCMVGCTSCQVWCIYDAISFPDPNSIKEIIKKRGVLTLAKQQLAEKKQG